jgi:hypothetical protein
MIQQVIIYDVKEDYNNTTAIYTGITGAEIGLLNYVNKEIELYNISNGLLSTKLQLPVDAPAEAFLNFSYCNGIYWVSDKNTQDLDGI